MMNYSPNASIIMRIMELMILCRNLVNTSTLYSRTLILCNFPRTFGSAQFFEVVACMATFPPCIYSALTGA